MVLETKVRAADPVCSVRYSLAAVLLVHLFQAPVLLVTVVGVLIMTVIIDVMLEYSSKMVDTGAWRYSQFLRVRFAEKA